MKQNTILVDKAILVLFRYVTSLSIVSWNINGLRAVLKKGFLDFVSKHDPDIICLQEIKCFKDQVPELLASFPSYESAWHPAERPGYSGVLTLFRKSVRQTQFGMGNSKFDAEGRVLIHEIGEAMLLNCYFPNGGASEARHWFKMDFLSEFHKFANDLNRNKPLIITGDINIAHRSIDIHDPIRLDGASGFKPEERAWMDDFLASGFVDTFRFMNPEVPDKYTWWSYRAGARQRNKGWRIDYFLVSDVLKSRIKKINHLENITGSDHCPLYLEINLN